MELSALLSYLDSQLDCQRFRDYCPNGLQVQGSASATHIVTGVTACLALIEAAIAAQANVLLVHHGYFWRGENPCIVGQKQQRLHLLLTHQINLIAYHLPLDAHPVWGNNIQLAKVLQLQHPTPIDHPDLQGCLFIGQCQPHHTGETFKQHLTTCLQREPLHIPAQRHSIERIAWCTGAGQDFIEYALDAKVDAFLTGEVSERTVHIAREAGIHFFAAGHHATERYGIQALGKHVADKFSLSHQFIDIANPV
jgi:dinuclear metal center YbgI/SA1388 family protein